MKKTKRGRRAYSNKEGKPLSGALAHYLNFTAPKNAGAIIKEPCTIDKGYVTIARSIN